METVYSMTRSTHLRFVHSRFNGRSTRSLAAVDASFPRGAGLDFHASAMEEVSFESTRLC